MLRSQSSVLGHHHRHGSDLEYQHVGDPKKSRSETLAPRKTGVNIDPKIRFRGLSSTPVDPGQPIPAVTPSAFRRSRNRHIRR